MLTAIVGTNWGDEGKGRMVDLLSSDYDIVVRYQGGNNAGHTVINGDLKVILNLLPSGVLRDTTVNIIGNGVVVDLEHLAGEISRLAEKGIILTPDRLKISTRAVICTPYHKMMDVLEEERLGKNSYGSTRRGIAPVYADKYMKKAIRMEDLLAEDTLKGKVEKIVEWKNLTVKGGYGAEVNADEIYAWLVKYGAVIKPFITDTESVLRDAIKEDKKVMFEAQLGSLRDIDFGIYPFTTSSSTIAAFAPIGAGIPEARLDEVVGIMKAYSSCVGAGPFTCEMFGDEGEALREAGSEYGAATGRPRRVGPIDIPASRYGAMVQGTTCVALTKLDVLSYMDKIPVCVAYEIDGEITKDFPSGDRLLRAKPVIEYLPGFKCDITGCRKPEDLPKEAIDYVKYIERETGTHIKYVSVGASREQIVIMD